MEMVFELAGEIVIVKIQGRNILFSNSATQFNQFVPLEFLKLSKEGILKEFPDLKDKPEAEMRQEAIRRFKEYVKKLGGEKEICDYVRKEFENMGYKLKSIKKEGFREVKFK